MSKSKLGFIAKGIEDLISREDSPAERGESAGRLLMAAIEAGFHDGPEHIDFILNVTQRAEQKNVNGFISAWHEAVWRLRGKPKILQSSDETFVDDCKLVANAIRSDMAEETVPTISDPDILIAKNAPGKRPTSPRDAVLLTWYEKKDSPTFHKYVNIVADWNELSREKKIDICFSTPGNINKDALIKAIAAAKKDRGDEPKPKRRRVMRKNF